MRHSPLALAPAPALALALACAPPAPAQWVTAPLPGLDDPETVAALRTHIQLLHDERGFSGAVLIARDGEPLFTTAVGRADAARNIHNTPDTRFNLASGNKMFTAVVIGQLVEQERLAFTDAIAAHLPAYPDADVAAAVTIHHLLSHTSGLPDYWDDTYEQSWGEITTHEQMMPFFTGRPLDFEPGARFAYSNTNYVVLGLIIEAVCGKPYAEVTRERIFTPLGMHATAFDDINAPDAGLAMRYADDDAEGTTWRLAPHGARGSAAGGGSSTLADILRFDRGLRDGTLLPPASVERLRAGRVPMAPGGSTLYGYGFIRGTVHGQPYVGHGGYTAGVFFRYRAFPETGHTAILFANRRSVVAGTLFEDICVLITDPNASLAQLVEASKPPRVAPGVVVLEAAPDDENRYWATIAKLAHALNDEDRAAYLELFARPDGMVSKSSAFEFMVQRVMPFAGGIAGLHAMSAPLKVSSSKYPIRAVTFHLDDGKPGYFGISLTPEGKIDHMSLFVKADLCRHGRDTACPEVTVRLDEME